MASIKKPAFEHNCERCIFLGQTIGRKMLVDLYAHENTSGTTMLIARYSNEPADYASNDFSVVGPEGHAELWCAKALYERRELEDGIH